MAPTKKFIDNVDQCIDDHLLGFVNLYPQLCLHTNYKTVVVPQKDVSNNVGIVCGGGGGHEPFAAGFVGRGMLNAAVSGSVFASPPSSRVFHAIKYVAEKNKGGVLVIILNYTGDILNFGIAIEKARHNNIKVDNVVVQDDCSRDPNSSKAGARGISGVVLVMKICGAMAEEGKSLEEIISMVNVLRQNLASMGACVRPCSLPGASNMLFELGDDEVEIGVGVHGEAGFQRIKYSSMGDVIGKIFKKICEKLVLVANEPVVIVVNNLGGISKLEENVIVKEVLSQSVEYGLKVMRIYAGHIMTSLEMVGVTISVLKLPKESTSLILQYLDVPTDAPCWPGCNYSVRVDNQCHTSNILDDPTKHRLEQMLLDEQSINILKNCLRSAAQSLIGNEEKLNRLDSEVGDGDCGSTLRRLSEAVIGIIDQKFDGPVNFFHNLADIAANQMGGTSGAIYCLFFLGMSKHFEGGTTLENRRGLWAGAIQLGLKSIMKYSQADEGDRTLLDVLIPVCKVFEQRKNEDFAAVLKEVQEVAETACENTKHLEARAGRASYVNQNLVTDMDAGAFGVKVIIDEIIKVLIK